MQITSVLLMALLLPFTGFAQSDSAILQFSVLPQRVFTSLDKKATGLNKKLEDQINRYWSITEKQEEKIKKQWRKKKPAFATPFLENTRGTEIRNQFFISSGP